MSKKNCPRCGKYLKNIRSKGSLEAHQRDSAFCKSMTPEEHAARMKAEKAAFSKAAEPSEDSEPWGIADQTVEGAMCSGCGVCFHDAHGFPVLCISCWNDWSPAHRGPLQRATIAEF